MLSQADFRHRGARKFLSGLMGQNAAGTIYSGGFDASLPDYEGRPVRVVVGLGEAAGTPDSFTVTLSLEQCSSAGGANNVALPDTILNDTTKDYDDSVVLNANNQEAVFEITPDLNLGKFIRVKAVIAFVNGTSPKMPLAAFALGEKRKWS